MNAFGYVPTPAIVAPIEFTLRVDDYQALGGHMDHAISIADVLAETGGAAELRPFSSDNPWPWQSLERPK